ncbi:MAG: MoaD/ThiS family protein [Myxococcota bacterium]
MPRVLVPEPYRGPTGGVGEVPVDGATIRECIEAVEARYPGFRAQVLDARGGQHRFVKLFVNGDLADPDDLDRALGSGDVIEILAAIAGG